MGVDMKQSISRWKHQWETWDLRLAILFSLILQIFLIFSAPLRKRMSKGYVLVPMWLAYLLADATAIFAAGLIVKGQGDTSGPFANPTLVAFWAPFLLVHLGGPDTITAFALEDDELWLRHLLGLGFPCWAVVYALCQSFPKSELRVSTLLIFIAGLVKYIERTRSLYLACSRTLKDSMGTEPDPGLDYDRFMAEYTSKIKARIPTKIEMIPPPSWRNGIGNKQSYQELSDLKVVQQAYKFHSFLKALVAGLLFSFRKRNESRDFFLKRTSRDAFKVVEVELNFLYDILYTKAFVVQGMVGYLIRILLFIIYFSSVALFYFMEKNKFEKVDIRITYSLLLGAISLDLISFVIVLYSDWTVVALTMSNDYPNWGITILGNLLDVDRKRWPKNPQKQSRCFSLGKIMHIVHRRWSKSLSQFNFLDYCLQPRAKWCESIVGFFGLTNILDGMKYVETVEFTDDLRDLIFEELKQKSEIAGDMETTKKMISARGDWAIWYRGHSHTNLQRWIKEVDFDESLLLWNIATNLVFYTDESSMWTNHGSGATATNANMDDKKNFRHMSKLLSDYMLYLLIMESSMISNLVGIGQTRFRDTCAEAKRFFHRRKIEEPKNNCLDIFIFCKCRFCSNQSDECSYKGEKGSDEFKVRACFSILSVNSAVEPIAIKGDECKSVFFDACLLAKELRKESNERMWEIISKVWVEMLSYAACHSKANIHAAQLSKGGQLITLVWLLMAHLGLGDMFRTEGYARAQLIVREELNKF